MKSGDHKVSIIYEGCLKLIYILSGPQKQIQDKGDEIKKKNIILIKHETNSMQHICIICIII